MGTAEACSVAAGFNKLNFTLRGGDDGNAHCCYQCVYLCSRIRLGGIRVLAVLGAGLRALPFLLLG